MDPTGHGGNGARAEDRDVGALDEDGPVALQDDGGPARREHKRVPGGYRPHPADGQRVVAADGDAPLTADAEGLVPANLLDAIAADLVGLVVLDLNVEVFLGVDVELLLALLVLEADLIEVVQCAAHAAAGLDAALRLVLGQGIGRHLLGVVDAADDDGPVRIALQKSDNHLLADARDVDQAPLLACPRRADAHPARTVVVALPLTVPVELHLYATVFVGV